MDNILIDTNIVVAYFGDYSRLSNLAEATVDEAAETGTVFVCLSLNKKFVIKCVKEVIL